MEKDTSKYIVRWGSYTDTRCCPETSRDANGLTSITELRFYLTQLEDAPKLYSAKAQRIEWLKTSLFVERFFNLQKTEVRRMDGGGSSKNHKGICNV